jgi:hypothetical protein
MSTELFRSADLLIRRVGDFGPASCVVAFDSFTDFRTLDRLGFGEEFLRGAGIDAIHVIPRDNDWYQYPEMIAAMAHVHAATRRYARVVAYGSSMGAYAAIRLAGLAGAHAVLALSPQYSIDPELTPWEHRWAECRQRFHRVWERTLPFPVVNEATVAFDPHNLDRRHIALLKSRFAFQPLRIPHAGHPVTGYLAEIGLLKEALLRVCHAPLDAAALAAEARARQGRSAHYLVTLSKRVVLGGRARRLDLMREAARRAPNDSRVLSRLGLLLGQAGRHEEARDLHRHALALTPDHPDLLRNFSLTLEAGGDLAAALAVMEQACSHSHGAAIYARRLKRLRARLVWRRRLERLWR